MFSYIAEKGEKHMNYRIEEFPGFKVVGVSNRIKTSSAFEVIPRIWEKAWQDGTMNAFMEFFQKGNNHIFWLMNLKLKKSILNLDFS